MVHHRVRFIRLDGKGSAGLGKEHANDARTLTGLDAQDADFRTGQRSMLFVLNEALSYGGNFDVSQMRYFSVNTVRVRPGHDQEWQEARKILAEAVKKANPNAHSMVYGVAAGMPNGTYLVFTPRKSLAEMDPNPAMGKAVQDAMGEDNVKEATEAARRFCDEQLRQSSTDSVRR